MEKTQLKLTDPSEISSFFSGPPTFLMDLLYICLAPNKNIVQRLKTTTNPDSTCTWWSLEPRFGLLTGLGPGPPSMAWAEFTKTESNLHTVIDLVWKKKHVFLEETDEGLFFFSGHKKACEKRKFVGLNLGIRTIVTMVWIFPKNGLT